MKTLCRLGLHRWRTFHSYIRGISLYERQACSRCGRQRTLWNRQQVINGPGPGLSARRPASRKSKDV